MHKFYRLPKEAYLAAVKRNNILATELYKLGSKHHKTFFPWTVKKIDGTLMELLVSSVKSFYV